MARLPRLWEEPFRMMSNMGSLLDNLENEFGVGFGTGYGRTDVYEKDGELTYEIELPGVSKEDVTARIEDDRLVVKGEIRRDESINQDSYMRMERRYGTFQKSFALPPQAERPEQVKARLEDGVLKVSIPLRESLRGQVVDIEIE